MDTSSNIQNYTHSEIEIFTNGYEIRLKPIIADLNILTHYPMNITLCE